MQSEPSSPSAAPVPAAAVAYGCMESADIAAAVRLYLESFPHRVRRWFRDRAHAECFYADVFELMRMAYGPTCFAAHHGGRLVGYLILTVPHTSLTRPLWRGGFLLRVVGHVLTGRFGWSLAILAHAVAAVLRPAPPAVDGPHVYVVAVAPGYRSQGIGTALLFRARAACVPRFGQLWLYAEADNQRAVTLYERLGFRTVHADPTQHTMVWEFREDRFPPTERGQGGFE